MGKYLLAFLISMVPIVELRGAMPIAMGMGIPFVPALVTCVIGNMLPVPIILLFVAVVLNFMKKIRHLDKIAYWVEEKAEKHKDKVTKYATWGLFLFVAVPLPGTGAWTGSLVAALIDMKFGKAILAVLLGVLSAGVIMTLISYGVLGFLSFLI